MWMVDVLAMKVGTAMIAAKRITVQRISVRQMGMFWEFQWRKVWSWDGKESALSKFWKKRTVSIWSKWDYFLTILLRLNHSQQLQPFVNVLIVICIHAAAPIFDETKMHFMKKVLYSILNKVCISHRRADHSLIRHQFWYLNLLAKIGFLYI